MWRNICGVLAVAGGYAAAIIGAGFASGQEIVSFFVRYSRFGFWGIVVACMIFALFAAVVLGFCIKTNINSYAELIDRVVTTKAVRSAINTVIFVCSAAAMCVMTACAGEIGRSVYGAPPVVGAAALTLLCGVIFLMNSRGIMSLNAALGGVLVVGIIFACLYILRYREHQTVFVQGSAAVSGFAYAGYNIIGTGAVLAAMSRFLKNKTDAILAAISAGIAIFIMITLIWGVLSIYYGKINIGEIPMLTMTFRQNNALGIFYSLMLSAAVLTTAVSSGYALIDFLGKRINRKLAAIIILIGSFFISGAGFSSLVDNVYRVCGYIGAAAAAFLIYKISIKMKNEENKRK